MNKRKFNILFFQMFMLVSGFISLFSINTYSQETGKIKLAVDSLSLDQIMTVVMQNFPAIKLAEESLNKADAQIGLAKSGYYPNVDANLNVSHVGPVPSLTVPDFGSFQLFPKNNFNAGLNVRQNIFDFGKTSSNVALASGNLEMMKDSLVNTKLNISLMVIKNYYTLVYLQQAVKIKDEQLATFNEHLENVQKKKATGSATNYEILSTQVKISVVESQKLDLEAARDFQVSILNSLLGMPTKTYQAVRETFTVSQPEIPQDSLVSYALLNRKDMQIALKKIDLASLHLNVVKSQNNPSLDFFANGGWKNGYVPDISEIRANYMVGLGVKVPIFDGTRSKYNVMMAKSSLESSTLASELTRRRISTDVVGNETSMITARKKLSQSQLQLSQAQEAYKLAKVNYSAGAITNLDLLDAATTVSESKLMLLKSQVDYVISMNMLKISLGYQLY